MPKRSPIVPKITIAMVADKSDGLIENGKNFEINSAVIIPKIYPITSELVVNIITSYIFSNQALFFDKDQCLFFILADC
jgi:hypothetical protein